MIIIIYLHTVKWFQVMTNNLAQSARAVEYVDYISVAGVGGS